MDSTQDNGLSLPTILNYLETQWRSFNEDRTRWEGERAHLQSTISLLKGEREGQQTLQRDLVRRIKMLEYALREERKKTLAATRRAQDNEGSSSSSATEDKEQGDDTPVDPSRFHTAIHRPMKSATSNKDGSTAVASSPGRDSLLRCQTKLRKYLDQMGYTDALISTPMRHSHLKSNAFMFYDQNGDQTHTPGTPPTVSTRGGGSGRLGNGDSIPLAQTLDSAVEPPSAWGDGGGNDHGAKDASSGGSSSSSSSSTAGGVNEGSSTSTSNNGATAGSGTTTTTNIHDDGSEFTLDMAATTSAGEEPPQSLHKQWKARTSLRSHFDAVRCLAFDDTAPLLLSASEDCTLKLWSLRAVATNKRTMHQAHIEPLFTFRGHTGPVYTCVMNSKSNLCFSGSADSSVMAWSLPDPMDDPYSTSGAPTRIVATLVGHTDAVWDLSHHPLEDLLASCSADGTVRLFDVKKASPLVSTLSAPDIGTPACAQFALSDPSTIVAGYVENSVVTFDVETGKQVTATVMKGGNAARINSLTTHPTQGLVITAHEDATIQFYDLKSGKVVHDMRAHTDGVSSVSLDAGGLYFASAGHDCSVRFWDLGSRSCVQELSMHRQKYDAGIHDAKFHPSMSFVATAGADSSVKIYQ